MFGVGVILFGLWALELLSLIPLSEVWYWVKGGYLAFGWVVWLPFLLAPTGIFDEKEKDEEYTTHTCDICGDKMKKGEGKHWRVKDRCQCVCETCLPTINDDYLKNNG